MITWVTVWVLTVTVNDSSYTKTDNLHTHYQLQYATQSICEKQRKSHRINGNSTRCDFQQVPMVLNK